MAGFTWKSIKGLIGLEVLRWAWASSFRQSSTHLVAFRWGSCGMVTLIGIFPSPGWVKVPAGGIGNGARVVGLVVAGAQARESVPASVEPAPPRVAEQKAYNVHPRPCGAC